jgi:hypothetical protein
MGGRIAAEGTEKGTFKIDFRKSAFPLCNKVFNDFMLILFGLLPPYNEA